MTPCSFTILFDMPHKNADDHEETITDSYTYYSSSSSSCSSPVDCALSLGPTSTRRKSPPKSTPSTVAAATSCMPAIRWDIFSQANKTSSMATARNGGSGSLSGCGGDPLLARRCANCDTTSTPLWRNGPRGPKSLCNACGIRYKKEERRVAATMAPYTSTSPSPIAAMETQKPQHAIGSYALNQHDNHPWGFTASQRNSSVSLSSGNNEFRFIRGYDGDNADDSALPCVSWCLNVPQPRAEYLHHY